MTTMRMHRCVHCGTPYMYYASGGMLPAHNDDKLCPPCKKVVEDALKGVPVRFERRWIPTDEYSREQIEEHQKDRLKESKWPVRRVFPGLFNTETGEREQRVSELMKVPGAGLKAWYAASWWESSDDPPAVTKQVWWDLENDCEAKDQRSKVRGR